MLKSCTQEPFDSSGARQRYHPEVGVRPAELPNEKQPANTAVFLDLSGFLFFAEIPVGKKAAAEEYIVGVAYDKAVCAVVCTASEETAERLGDLLRRWAVIECVALTTEWTKRVSFPADGGARLLILDLDSVELLEKTLPLKHDLGLIVISGDAGRAIYSYRWHPAAFLKPDFDLRRLSHALAACEKYWTQGRLGLESPYRRRTFRLPLGRIRYVEAAAHYCLFNQGKSAIRLRFSIDEMEKLLPEPPFVRCHRSYLVHLGAVAGMTYTSLTLHGGGSLPLGRTYVQSLRAALQAWQRGETQYDDFYLGLRRPSGGTGEPDPHASGL